MGFYPTPDPSESPEKPPSASTSDKRELNEWLTKLDLSGLTIPPPPPPKPSPALRTLNRIVFYGILLFVVVLAGGFALSFYQQSQRDQASRATYAAISQATQTAVVVTQTAIANAYGVDTLALCTKPKTTNRRAPLPAGKVLVLVDNTTNIHEDIFKALPADLRAQTKEGLAVVVCIKQDNQLYDTASYKGSSGTIGTCQQWRISQNVSLVNVKTGEVVESMSFLGAVPPPCPEMITVRKGQVGFETRYGNAPAAITVANWIKQKMSAVQEAG